MSPNPTRKNPVSGPGPKGSTQQAIVSRWSWQMATGWLYYASLACGHKVRLGEAAGKVGDLIPCGECPPGPAWAEEHCACGATVVPYDAQAAKGLTAAAIRKRWPRGYCGTCHRAIYGNWEHYVQGRWK